MAEAGGIRAGKAFVEMLVKDGFTKTLNNFEKRLGETGKAIAGMGAKFTAVGAAITAPLVLSVSAFAKLGDEVNKASDRTGVSVKALTQLKYAADQSGASLEVIEGGLKKMQVAITDAANGSATLQASFNKLGVSVDSLLTKSGDEQMLILGEAISKVSDSAEKTALTMDIFGKSGTALLPMFAGGEKGIKALTDRADELGLTFGKDAADAATLFGDTLDDLTKELSAVAFAAGAAVADGVQPFMDMIVNALPAVIKFTQEHAGLIKVVGGVGAVVTAVGATLLGLGLAMQAVTIATTATTAAVTRLGAAMTFLMANPVVAVGALVAVVATLYVAIRTASIESAKLDDSYKKQIESAKAARTTTAQQVQTLDQLASKQRLTSSETKEAARIISELQSKYGQLGLSINATTGQVVGFGSALARINKIEGERQKNALAAGIKAEQANIKALKKELDTLTDSSSLLDDAIFYAAGGNTRITQIEGQIGAAIMAAAELQRQLKALNPPQGNQGRDDNQRAVVIAKNYEEAAAARAKLNELEGESASEDLSSRDKALRDINARYEEQIRLVNDIRSAAIRIGDFDAAKRLEDEKTRITQDAEAKRAKIRKEAADEAKAAEDEKKAKAEDQADFMLKLERDLAKAKGDTAKADALDKQIAQREFEAQLEGMFGGDEKAKQKARDMQAQLDRLGKTDNTREHFDSQGTFNAAALRSLQGGVVKQKDPTQERMANGIDEIVRNTRKPASAGYGQ